MNREDQGTLRSCYDPQFISYLKNRKWAVYQQSKRKLFLFRVAQRSKSDPDLAGKIGGILIYNQVIEQFLVDIVEMSIYYIKAKIWPVAVSLDVELDKATFGKVIEYFRQYGTVEPNRDRILTMLKQFNTKRNQVVHDLFDVEDLHQLSRELGTYADLADDIVELLDAYDNEVCRNFSQLEKEKDLKKLVKECEQYGR